jgi:O-antigen chain-terminating methyltransferase
MLDVKNPEIRVDEIMQRIQEKVRSRREARAAPLTALSAEVLQIPGWNQVDERLGRAQQVALVGASLPSMTRMRGLKRSLAGVVAKLFLRTAQLITRDQREFNVEVLDILRPLHEALAHQAAQLSATRVDLAALRAELTSVRAELSKAQARIGELGAQARSEAANSSVNIGQLRTSLSLQERQVNQLLEEIRKRLPASLDVEQLQTLAAEAPHIWDAIYLHFEDQFRGSREEIKRRIAVYLPKFRAAEAGSESSPILDLGCGRGELLEVLREAGLTASGVDTNRAAVEQCLDHGLSVELRDAFEALGKIPNASLGGLTALHVVEHLPFPLVLKLLDESLRVLRPGGIAIFETPNPNNVLVGSSTFYVDPTHRNPVHPQALQYLMEARGMVRVETMMLHPYAPEARVPEAGSELARRFNEHFYGPQDYAALGHRP